MKNTTRTPLALATAAALGLAAHAASAQDVMSLDEWQTSRDAMQGWSAEQVIGLDVQNANGEDIGEVENLVIGPEGDVDGLILEVGGFLDIGDTHLMVPWGDVEVAGGTGELEHVVVPVADDNWDQFDLSPASGDVEIGPRQFRATELIGDYSRLGAARTGYGMVSDLLFDDQGKLQSVVVNQSGGYGGGYQAYPFGGYDQGFEPGADVYDLPYEEDEIGALEPFDYEGRYGTDPS